MLAGCLVAALASTAQGQVNVVQFHNNASRDGVFIDPAFTPANVTNLHRDLTFDGTISGNVYAQPLYIEGGPNGKAMIIAVTESNNIYALDAANGSVLWKTNVGQAVPLSSLPCGNIDPLGITGTPVVDLATRALFFDAMTTPDNGTTKRHLIYSLNVDSGAINPGWPVDVNAAAHSNGTNFTSVTQNQRSALAVVSNRVYVTYGGHAGDCGTYYGWIVGISLTNSADVQAWATPARGGGSWGVGGVASDGLNPFIATGNTFGAGTWMGGEAIIRFQTGPVFSGSTNDYWAATNWMDLDDADLDIGGCGALLVDVPGATPSKLVLSLGKDGNAYLLNRTNLGGVHTPVAQAHVASSQIRQAAATYRTSLGTYVVYQANPTSCSGGGSHDLGAFLITAANPPAIVPTWCALQNGGASPFVTSTDGTNNVIVWGYGAEGDQRLHGFDGDTGAVIYNGGGAGDAMAGTRHFNTAIVARGRIYVGTDNKIYAFSLPVSPIVLTNLASLADGSFQFGFTNTPGLTFRVWSSTDVSLPFSSWTNLGFATETATGQFRFTDASGPSHQQRFYRVSRF